MTLQPSPETSLDKRLVPKALALIQSRGMTVRFHVEHGKRWDPVEQKIVFEEDGEGDPVPSDTYDKKVTPPVPYKAHQLNGSGIIEGDMQVFLPAKDLEFEPVHMMSVELPGDEFWRISHIGRVYTGERLALWEIGLRRHGTETI